MAIMMTVSSASKAVVIVERHFVMQSCVITRFARISSCHVIKCQDTFLMSSYPLSVIPCHTLMWYQWYPVIPWCGISDTLSYLDVVSVIPCHTLMWYQWYPVIPWCGISDTLSYLDVVSVISCHTLMRYQWYHAIPWFGISDTMSGLPLPFFGTKWWINIFKREISIIL